MFTVGKFYKLKTGGTLCFKVLAANDDSLEVEWYTALTGLFWGNHYGLPRNWMPVDFTQFEEFLPEWEYD